MANVEGDTARWYRDYYARKGSDRNDLFNPGVLFQELAYSKCFIQSFSAVPRESRILDVGGGEGSGLRRLIALGYAPEHLSYIDILSERVEAGKRTLPTACTLMTGDAACCPEISDGSYDVVTASTMFIQLQDDELAARIAREMVRICRPDGLIILFDWAYDFGRSGYHGTGPARIGRLFGVGETTKLVARRKGQLLPPLGRTLSKYAGPLYFAVQALPFATGLFGTTLRKS